MILIDDTVNRLKSLIFICFVICYNLL